MRWAIQRPHSKELGDSMTIRRSWSVMALAAAALLAAPATQAQSVLRVAPETLSRILDPHFTTSFTTRDLGYLVYDTLFAVDDKFEPKPQMVESYTRERRQAHLHLRPAAGPEMARRPAGDGGRLRRLDPPLGLARQMGQTLTRFTPRSRPTDAEHHQAGAEGALRPGARQPGQDRRAGAVHDARAHRQDAGQRAGEGDRRLGPLQVPRRPA